ncbi:MAG TPA: sigma 54-interacting transcriptional regulator [Gemmataceae bacterium]|nr:sigma 54-interacting transcriptional regulator [Gemmataceae bacterium]
MSEEPSSGTPRRLAKNFRWQAFFQRCAEPLFVLDRRLRLLFVNHAWEVLTGMPAAQAHVLICRRSRPTTVDDSNEDILAHALTPSPEVLHGVSERIRRLLPGRDAAERWWDIDFLPLRQEGEQGGHLILGRIRPVPGVELAGETPLSEKLVNLRLRRVERFSLDAWNSSLPAMRRLAAQVRLAGQVATPVLLVGEEGTGKQTLARTIHYLSARRDGACAVLDCERLPPTAVAALLFGERAAGRAGVTAVYLREPAYLPRDVQLRLCEMIARSNGPGAEGTTAPRILAGCAMPPAQAVRAGRLLDELACALSLLVIEVPPLRERRSDLPALVERLLERACADREARVTSLSADAWAVLRGYVWPGNMRELYAVLRAAAGRANGEQIRVVDLPAELRRAVEREQTPPRPAERALPLEQLLEEAERRLILLALRRTHGHKARAARLLSIPRPRLWRRMLKLGIVDTEAESSSSVEDAKDEE